MRIPASPRPPISASACPEACLSGVGKTYRMGRNVVTALADLTLDFDPGTFWAIMGPSGSGKSTLLNLVGCLDRPTSGTYILKGSDVGLMDDDALSELRLRRLGFIFQSFNLVPQLTVQENIALPLFYGGVDPVDSARRARDLAEQLNLADRLSHRPSELSGGQQQRVAIARALANDPSILLADEPTGSLDSATGREIMDLLSSLNRQGRTIIIVTHDLSVAAHATSRLYLKDGRIEKVEGNG